MKYLPAANVNVVAASGFLIKNLLATGLSDVGNGLDRSGISVFTAMLYKIRIEYNTLQLEPEQASWFPTTSFYISIY